MQFRKRSSSSESRWTRWFRLGAHGNKESSSLLYLSTTPTDGFSTSMQLSSITSRIRCSLLELLRIASLKRRSARSVDRRDCGLLEDCPSTDHSWRETSRTPDLTTGLMTCCEDSLGLVTR